MPLASTRSVADGAERAPLPVDLEDLSVLTGGEPQLLAEIDVQPAREVSHLDRFDERSARVGEPLQVTLVFGVRHEHSLLYRDEFETLERLHPNFHFWPTLTAPEPGWTGRTGRVQQHLVEAVGSRREGGVGPGEGERSHLHCYKMTAGTDPSQAVESLNKICEQLSQHQVEEFFIPLVVRLSKADWFTSKISATGLYNVPYGKATPPSQEGRWPAGARS